MKTAFATALNSHSRLYHSMDVVNLLLRIYRLSVPEFLSTSDFLSIGHQ